MSTKVFGVKIILNDKAAPFAQNTNIGLYNVAGSNSEFRWIQNAVGGVSNWMDGLIADKGIGPYSRHIDISRGGNVATPGDCSVRLPNTIKLHETLKAANIYLTGCRFEIWLFTDSTPSIQWSGICQQPTYDSREYRIQAKGFHTKRIANIAKVINATEFPNASEKTINKIVPVTIGVHGNSAENYARGVRTADKETVYKNTDFGFNLSLQPETSIFPVTAVVGQSPVLQFDVAVGIAGDLNDTWDLYYDNMYAQVVYGESGLVGQIRKVSNISTIGMTNRTVRITLDNYFTEDLTISGTDQTWIKLFTVDSQYDFEHWPCGGPINSSGDYATYGADIFSHDRDTDTFNQLSSYGYDLDITNTGKTRFKLSGNQFTTDIDSQDSYLIRPMSSIALVDDESLATWFPDSNYGASFKKKSNGFFSASLSNLPSISINGTSQDATDINETTYYGATLTYPSTGAIGPNFFAFKCRLPEAPENFDFDKVYLLVDCDRSFSESVSGIHWFKPKYRRFLGSPFDIGETATFEKLAPINTAPYNCRVKNTPDFYFGHNGNNNLWFDAPFDTVPAELNNVRKYTLFELSGISSRDQYNQIYELAIMLYCQSSISAGATADIKLYEAGIIFHQSADIKSNIYTRYSGRLLGGSITSTWGGRRTANQTIFRPKDILEHVCRLQNWSDTSITPTLGWGLQYADSPLISTSSFDSTDPEYTSLDSCVCAAQFTDYDDCWTDKLKRSVCRDFSLASYSDKRGYESVKRVSSPQDISTDTITLADITDRSKIKISDPDPQDVYCEPFVRYQKNTATDEYTQTIRITNASAPTYNSDFVQGMTGTEAQVYWERCNALWRRVGVINKPPSDMTDMTWANGDDAYYIAKEHLCKWIDTQYNPEIQFPLHFNRAGTWEECHRFSIQLPHQTNNAVVQCRATDIVVDPNPPHDVMVTAIMYTGGAVPEYLIQDTMDVMSDNNYNWQDHMQTYAERAEGLDDRQDTM